MTELTNLTPDLWVTEEPLKLGPAHMNHRMTVVRLASGKLWVHSPIAYSDAMHESLAALGDVSDFVAPSIFHDLHWTHWCAAFPEARFHAPEGLRRRQRKVGFTDDLAGVAPDSWGGGIEQVTLAGMPKVQETVFHHPQSGTLIVADLVFNYLQPQTLTRGTRLLLSMTGANGRMAVSRLFRFMIKDREAFSRSLDNVLAWDFERLIVGHGEIAGDGHRQLAEATKFVHT